MNRIADVLLTDLRYLVRDLGKDGGSIGPSVYDTAQVLRMAPPADGVLPALEWLLAQQKPDGGWGDPAVPRARDVPTLAAVLALHTHSRCPKARARIRTGLAFLHRQALHWDGPLADDIPVAAELILPTLVAQARAAGLEVPEAPYAALAALGHRRRRLMAQMMIRPGTPIVHSWEAWGQNRDAALLDGADSMGHNPAATAAWLYVTQDEPDLVGARKAAQRYLARAAQATGMNIPGIAPPIWPYERNEQTVSLFMVFLAGLIDHDQLREAVHAQIAQLWRSLRPDGLGVSDHFVSDGDITAMVFALGAALGYRPNLAALKRYIVGDSCLTYPHEMQRSFSATAHAAHTLVLLGDDPAPLLNYLCERRAVDGRWLGDKWHASWLYLTSHIIHALIAAGRTADALAALPALLAHQHPDGSWGVTDAISEETAYGVLALLAFHQARVLPTEGQQALYAAGEWLCRSYRPLTEETGACWIAKGLYRPHRISQMIQVSATFAYASLAESDIMSQA